MVSRLSDFGIATHAGTRATESTVTGTAPPLTHGPVALTVRVATAQPEAVVHGCAIVMLRLQLPVWAEPSLPGRGVRVQVRLKMVHCGTLRLSD